MPNVGEGEEGSKTHGHVCTYATIMYVLHMYPKTSNAIKKIKNKNKCSRDTLHNINVLNMSKLKKLFYLCIEIQLIFAY